MRAPLHSAWLLLPLGAALVVACNDADDSASGLTHSASDTGDAGPPDGSPGKGGEPGAAGDEHNAAAPTKKGSVVVLSDNYIMTTTTSSGTASRSQAYESSFTASFVEAPLPSCEEHESSGCTVRTCNYTYGNPSSDAGIPVVRLPHAGGIRLSGMSTPITLTPTSSGLYANYFSQNSTFWYEGVDRTLTIDAEGADVPEFHGSLRAPNQAVIMKPLPAPLPSGGSTRMQFARDSSIDFEWANAGPAQVDVSLSQQASTGPSSFRLVTITCTFAGAARTGSIPAVLLSTLVAGTSEQGGLYTTVRAKTHVASPIVAGDWAIDWRLESNAKSSDDSSLYSYLVNLR
ncbi:hypothetical protein LVJ94_32910 [Pendulispora rubella]|uniref:Uncharacterized protein n=1 Tax=Pendulispora rubella TaxID=2741070 RepID=A0ABZ2KUF6_9BACT